MKNNLTYLLCLCVNEWESRAALANYYGWPLVISSCITFWHEINKKESQVVWSSHKLETRNGSSADLQGERADQLPGKGWGTSTRCQGCLFKKNCKNEMIRGYLDCPSLRKGKYTKIFIIGYLFLHMIPPNLIPPAPPPWNKVTRLTGRGGGSSSSTCLTGFGASTGFGCAPTNVGGSCKDRFQILINYILRCPHEIYSTLLTSGNLGTLINAVT